MISSDCQKKRNRSTSALFCFIFFFLITPLHALEITDATHTQVKIKDSVSRVVTLAPSLGELAADILADQSQPNSGNEVKSERRLHPPLPPLDNLKNKIVGVSEGSDFPSSLKKISSVGPFHQFNLEKVFSLQPDLVFATLDGNPKDKVLHLRELGVPVVVVNTSSFAEIEQSMLLVAQSLGQPSSGQRMVEKFKQGIKNFREKPRPVKKRRILLQVGDEPLVVAGKGTFLQECLQLLQAINVYEDSDAHYPKPSLEDVVTRNPDVIIILAMGTDSSVFKKMEQKWAQFPQMLAVKNKTIRVIQSDSLVRPTLRILDGLAILEKSIYE